MIEIDTTVLRLQLLSGQTFAYSRRTRSCAGMIFLNFVFVRYMTLFRGHQLKGLRLCARIKVSANTIDRGLTLEMLYHIL